MTYWQWQFGSTSASWDHTFAFRAVDLWRVPWGSWVASAGNIQVHARNSHCWAEKNTESAFKKATVKLFGEEKLSCLYEGDDFFSQLQVNKWIEKSMTMGRISCLCAACLLCECMGNLTFMFTLSTYKDVKHRTVSLLVPERGTCAANSPACQASNGKRSVIVYLLQFSGFSLMCKDSEG